MRWWKKMKINQVKLIISAVSQKQYPDDSLPEIAVAGRSNVGKSSFINKMVQRKKLVRTSGKPGKTRTLNFYKLNEDFYFVDVPGYGYAKVSKEERAKWGRMMEEYFQTRMNLNLVILITDIRHQPTKQDIQMYEYLTYYQLPVLVIATKLDKLKKHQVNRHINEIKHTFSDLPDHMLVPFSAMTGEGTKEAWQVIKQYLSNQEA